MFVPDDPANLSIIPGHIEIDGSAMARFFTEFFAEFDLTIKPKATKIAATTQDGREVQVPKTTDQDKEPDAINPAPKNKTHNEAAQELP